MGRSDFPGMAFKRPCLERAGLGREARADCAGHYIPPLARRGGRRPL